jgi:hypothetical protein
MKKLIILSMLIVSLGCKAITLNGTYTNGKVAYTFTNDTLCIDEIGVEGNCFAYKMLGKHIQTIDALYQSDSSIEIYRVYKKKIKLLIGNKIYTFRKK